MSATRGSKNQPLKQIGVLEGSSENATTTSAKFELGAHVSSRLCHLPSPCISTRPARLSILSLACKSFSSLAMPIDLNKLPHTRGESLPDLNEEPAHEEEQEDQVHLHVHIQDVQPLPDLNQEPEQDEEDPVYLEVHLQGQPLPDLQVYLQGQPLPDLNEHTYDQEEIDQLPEGQS